MKAIPTALPEVLLLQPRVHDDARGDFFEAYNQAAFDRLLQRRVRFVQDNQSTSCQGVLRGLHLQWPQAQGKLVRVLAGEIFDVAVDARRASPTCGQWVAQRLSSDNRHQLWVPEGFAHGYLALSERAVVFYKTTAGYAPADERCMAWNDPALAIDWPLDGRQPILSGRDAAGASFDEVVHAIG